MIPATLWRLHLLHGVVSLMKSRRLRLLSTRLTSPARIFRTPPLTSGITLPPSPTPGNSLAILTWSACVLVRRSKFGVEVMENKRKEASTKEE
ncbi:MAG: hypothetical protein ACLR71_15025 [[Clostridium] scindens]